MPLGIGKMQIIKRYAILTVLLLLNVIISANDVMFQNTNIISSDYFYSGIKNPAVLNGLASPSYSVFFKNSFSIDNFGVLIPFDDTIIGFGANNCSNGFYENNIMMNHSFNDLAVFGFSFNVIYDKLSSHNLYHNLNLGVELNPFAKEFKKQGQYIEMLFSFYINNLLNDDYIKDDFTLTYGAGLGINYDKDRMKIDIIAEKSDNFNLAGNIKVRILNKKYLFSSFDINGVSLGLQYDYKDMKLLAAFLRNKGINSFQMGIVYLPGSYKKVVVEDMMKLGLEAYRNKDYDAAKEYFTKVMLITKHNREAKQYIQIINERLKMVVKTKVNYMILHIMELLKKKKKKIAKKEFLILKKKYPEFEYKWKILYNKFKDLKVAKKNVVTKKRVDERNNEYYKIKKNLEDGNLRTAFTEFNNLKVEDKNKYKQLGKDINNAINSKKSELLKDETSLSKEQIIAVYEKILKELDPNDPHKKDVIGYYINKGEDLYRNGKYEAAIKMWKKVLEYDENNSDALIYIKTTQKKIGEK